jgi:alanine racemase
VPETVDSSALRRLTTADPVHHSGGQFSATVISVKRVGPGTPVSYGYHYRTQAQTTLALVSAGFADGVPRSASGKAFVRVGDNLCRVAGRIAMDQFIVDCGDTPVSVGDEVEIWGSSPTIEQWAEWSSRPVDALLAHVGDRVVRQ